MFLPIILIHTAFREIQNLMGNIWIGFACCRYLPLLDMEHRHSIQVAYRYSVQVVDSKPQVVPRQAVMLCFSMLMVNLTVSSDMTIFPCWWWVLVVQFLPLEVPECAWNWMVSTRHGRLSSQLWAQRWDRKCWMTLCPRETQPFFRF